MMAEGAKPKVMSSAKESSSLPIGDDTLSKRADMPSKKSNTAPTIIHNRAMRISPRKALYVAIQPEIRLQHVIEFGIFLTIIFAIV